MNVEVKRTGYWITVEMHLPVSEPEILDAQNAVASAANHQLDLIKARRPHEWKGYGPCPLCKQMAGSKIHGK
jgi:hypothetical protein